MAFPHRVVASIVCDTKLPIGLINKPGRLSSGWLEGGRNVSAIPAALQPAINATRRKGHICFVGWGRLESGTWFPMTDSCKVAGFGTSMTRARCSKTDRYNSLMLELLIMHQFPMEQVEQAFHLQATGDCAKVLLYPWIEKDQER